MHPRKLLRIARWEVTKNAGGVDRRTAAVAVGALLLLGALAPAIAGSGVAVDRGIYRVGVAADSPYYPVAAGDDTFAVHNPEPEALREGDVDLLVTGTDPVTVRPAADAKGRAAAAEFRSAVEAYNDAQLRREGENETAAFPVSVTLQYESRSGDGVATVGGGGGDAGSGAVSGGGGDAAGGSGDTGGSGVGNTDDSTGSVGSGSGSGGSDSSGGVAGGTSGVGGALGNLGSGSSSTTSPSTLAPPFPFESLVLAFIFVVPLNFLIQAYGSTFLSERLNRRGELLLVSPVTRLDIVAGKTLPYFLGAMALEAAIAVGLTYLATGSLGGLVSVLAVAPLVLLFLAATFLGAMFARSFKELTFLTVTITVTLTSYAFVPAIFTNAGPVALISPLTIVVRNLQGQAVSLLEFAFSTLPPLLTAAVLFGLGAGLYREEDMFAQRSVPLKVLDALAGPIRKRWHVGAVTALLIPFVFVLELLAVAFLFALGELSIPLVLVAVAVIEEVAKSLHVYASFEHGRFERGLRSGIVLGAISGVGFFLAEKLTAIAQAVGLDAVPTGEAALGTGLIQGADPVVLLVASLALPLALHVVTAAISAAGASRSRRAYVATLGAAIAVHLAYNLAIVGAVVGRV
ncbi:MAG: PrsW family intramembrane metalloprotease [Haloarculaceae archaeon]